MNQRKDESDEEYRARRAAYDQARPGVRRGKTWRKVQRTEDGNGVLKSVVKKRRGADPEDRVQVDKAIPFRTSTHYAYEADGSRRVTNQWVMERPEDKDRLALWQDMAAGLAAELPRIELVVPPLVAQSEILVVYPVGDHHNGLYVWGKETGKKYDLEIAESVLVGAFQELTAAAPPSECALVALLGDYFHYDSMEAVTPTNRNLLDADGRAPKMIDVGLRTVRRCLALTLVRHSFVHVIVEIGNHDPMTAVFLAIALKAIYENEPRVTVDISPSHFHYYTWRSCLIGTHHGHGPKPEKLPLIMARDCPQEWAQCAYRYWLTGHIHRERVWDEPGCRVEAFPILAPGDSWAFNKGYRSKQEMHALVFHERTGLKGRHLVNPEMIGST